MQYCKSTIPQYRIKILKKKFRISRKEAQPQVTLCTVRLLNYWSEHLHVFP